MKRYRLKKEAVQFFLEKHATKIDEYDVWERLSVDVKALEEVKETYLDFGHKKSETVTDLSGWDEKGSRFHFTIHFPSVKFREHDEFSKGVIIRELMNKIQENVSDFYAQFLTNEVDDTN